jgi:DNA ligase-1
VNEGYLLKWKPMEDAEAVVKGFEEKMHNGNGPQKDERGYTKRSSHKSGKVPTGTLGALLVQSPEWPKEFSIGSGFTDSQRSDIWHNKALYLGSSVKFKFQRSGTKDVPRVPTFLGFRSSLDISA